MTSLHAVFRSGFTRMTAPHSFRLAAAFAVAAALGPGARGQLISTNWSGVADWATTGNWSNGVASASSAAQIATGTATVSAATSVGSLTLSGGTLTGAGPLTITSNGSTWSG